MPITELVPLHITPDAASRAEFEAKFPGVVQSVSGADGLLSAPRLGHVLRVDGQDVAAERRVLMALEWHSPHAFSTFVHSGEVESFRGPLIQYLTAVPTPELHESSQTATKTLEAPLTQIFRVPTSDATRQATAAAWDEFVAAVKTEVGEGVESYAGLGLPGIEGLGKVEVGGRFLGMVGWEGGELERTLKKEKVAACLNKFRSAGGEGETTELVVKY